MTRNGSPGMERRDVERTDLVRPGPVYTAVTGTNADLIQQVARLYLKPGMSIADVTYGRGVFWQKVEVSQYALFASDLLLNGVDCRSLPYEDGSKDVVVIDLPYMHESGKPLVESRYRNAETTKAMSHADIIRLYTEAMAEARRVLKPGGQCWVKIADEISSGKQCWGHIEILHAAEALGYEGQDLFVFVRPSAPVQAKRQLHARKSHSYLWIFAKKGAK
jgi:hypothetical protein